MEIVNCGKCGAKNNKTNKDCNECGQKLKKKSKFWLYFWIFILSFWVIYFVSTSLTPQNKSEETTKTERKKTENEIAIDNLKLVYEWQVSGFGRVMLANFTIENTNDFGAKDIKIICDMYSKSKTKIGENEAVIYDIFPKKSKKEIKEFNMGIIDSQAESATCNIIHFVKLI